MKIINKVQFNTEEAYVLNKIKPLTYTAYNNNSLLIGTNGLMYNCYVYHEIKGSKAFGGRAFDIPMADGSIQHANGQWWQGSISLIERVLGLQLESVTMRDVVALKQNYVFTTYAVDSVKWHGLKDKCKVAEMHTYLYYEYGNKLKEEV